MTIAFAVFIIVGLPMLFYAFLMFDRIVRIEYEMNSAAWEKDGNPYGFFWKAPECTWFKSGWARNRLSLAWLFSTPEWMLDSTDSRRYLKRIRICVLAWNVLVLSVFFGVLPSAN